MAKKKEPKNNKDIQPVEQDIDTNRLDSLYLNVKGVIERARATVYRAANSETIKANWEIGQYIVEEEQHGKARADYGAFIIKDLSKRLMKQYKKGFTITNLKYMRQFYLTFPIGHALRDQLSWTHYRTLIKVKDEKAREFYINESIKGKWDYRFLEREIDTKLYERLLISKIKEPVLEEVKNLQTEQKPDDLIKDPYVLDFLGLSEQSSFHESELEQAIMDNLQRFLLELGKGFAFIARQKRISIDGINFYPDLVFYHCILKCYIIIELKVGNITPQDIGQLDFYVNYWDMEEIQPDDKPTIGLILGTDKSNAIVRYTQIAKNDKLFASKYQLYLPSEEELKKEILEEKERIERNQRLNQEE